MRNNTTWFLLSSQAERAQQTRQASSDIWSKSLKLFWDIVWHIIWYAYYLIRLCVNHSTSDAFVRGFMQAVLNKEGSSGPTTSNMLTMAPYFFFTSHIILSHPVSLLQPRIVSVNFSLSTPMVVLSWGPWNPWWTVVLNGKQNAVRFVLPRQRWRQAAWRYSFFFFGWGNGRGWDWRDYEILNHGQDLQNFQVALSRNF